MAVASDGALVTGGAEGRATLYALDSGHWVKRFNSPSGTARNVLVDLKRGRLLTGRADGTVRIWNPGDGAKLAQIVTAPDRADLTEWLRAPERRCLPRLSSSRFPDLIVNNAVEAVAAMPLGAAQALLAVASFSDGHHPLSHRLKEEASSRG